MNLKLAVAVVGIAAFVAGPAQALSLLNEDSDSYDVQIIQGEGSAAIDTFTIDAGQKVEDFCQDGCTLQLPDGTSYSSPDTRKSRSSRETSWSPTSPSPSRLASMTLRSL